MLGVGFIYLVLVESYLLCSQGATKMFHEPYKEPYNPSPSPQSEDLLFYRYPVPPPPKHKTYTRLQKFKLSNK